MRLSIVNYGLDPNSEVPKYAKKEDDELINMATGLVQDLNFGTGAIIVSEAFHTGLKNSNHRKYMEKGMQDSILTFYKPHLTPFLMHHESGGGMMGGNPELLSVGSNILSKYVRRAMETPLGVATGYGKVVTFIPSDSYVGGQRSIDALRSRRLLTLSIGARVNDKDYRCSICGLSLYDEECEHSAGTEYEGKMCMAEVYNPLFREYSAVYNPADVYAAVRRMDVLEGEGSNIDKHHVIDQEPGPGYLHIYDAIGKTIHPSTEVKHSEGGEAMSDKAQKPSQSDQAADAALNDIIESYEDQLREKDKVIISLATALRDRLDEIEELKSIQDLEGPTASDEPEESSPDEEGEAPTAAAAGDVKNPSDSNESPNDSANVDTEGTPDNEAGDTDEGVASSATDSNDDPVSNSSEDESPPASQEGDASVTPERETGKVREVLSRRHFESITPLDKSGSPLGSRSIADAIRRNQ